MSYAIVIAQIRHLPRNVNKEYFARHRAPLNDIATNTNSSDRAIS